MNRSNKDMTIYSIAAIAIFVFVVIMIVIISVSSIGGAVSEIVTDSGVVEITPIPDAPIPDESAETTELPTPIVNPAITDDTSSVAQTSAPTVTEEAPVTTAAPVTTTPTTQNSNTPSVSAPSANVSDSWAAELAKYPNTVLAVTADAGQEYIDKIIFLGDSTTNGLRAYSMLKDGRKTTQVWTPQSGTLTLSNVSFETIVYPETNEQITIKEAVTRKQPEYLVITLGVNGVSFMDEEYFKSEYKGMLETVMAASPNTKIICQSIFPVARSYPSLKSINNDKIRAANKWILEVAAEVGVKFIDTYSVLADSEGWLPESYHNGDGIHLHTVSFNIELDNLRTHAYK